LLRKDAARCSSVISLRRTDAAGALDPFVAVSADEKGTHLFFALRRAATTAKLDAAANAPFDLFNEPAVSRADEKGTHLFFALRRAATTPKLDAAANAPFDLFNEPAVSRADGRKGDALIFRPSAGGHDPEARCGSQCAVQPLQ
jgi:hypothetical protein